MPAPTNIAVPVILGVVATGEELTATYGIWTDRPRSFTFQWKADGGNVGSNSSSYTLQAGDSGKSITVVVTATNLIGSTQATSAAADASAWTTYAITTELGCKTLTAVGSITGGTGTLVLTSNPGFAIGDKIIVATGGESGGGLRGSKGVGGYWPTTSYATTAALLAATPATGTYAWAEDTGKVYVKTASSWTDLTTDQQNYYFSKATPRALLATITNVVGTTLTLDTSATVTATNATVYFNNTDLLNAAWEFGGPYNSPYKKWTVPAGSYALGDAVRIQHNDWIIQGASSATSVFFSPAGTRCCNLLPLSSDRIMGRDLGLLGNARSEGFGMSYSADPTATPAFPSGGFNFSTDNSCIGNRVKTTDVFNSGSSFAVDMWYYNSAAVLTEGLQSYTQWQFDLADHTGGGTVDCTVTSPYLVAGMELFRGTHGMMIRPVLTNATYSLNSDGDFLVDTPVAAIGTATQLNDGFSLLTPIVSISTNIHPSSGDMLLGGVILNPSLIQTGRVDAANTISLVGVTINVDNPNIQIIGTYPSCSSPQGIISSPNAIPGALSGQSAVGIISDGTGEVFTGLRFTAVTASPIGNIHVESGDATITTCVMDASATGSGTITERNTVTNAAYALFCSGGVKTFHGSSNMVIKKGRR